MSRSVCSTTAFATTEKATKESRNIPIAQATLKNCAYLIANRASVGTQKAC